MIYDREGMERNASYIQMYQERCISYDIEVEPVLTENLPRRLQDGEMPVCALVRTICPEINRRLEQERIPVFNSYQVSYVCNHKGRTLEYFKDRVLSVPSLTFSRKNLLDILSKKTGELICLFENQFIYSSSFEQEERELICKASDFVVKAVDGHGGTQVFSIGEEKRKILDGIGGHDFVLQPMIGSGASPEDRLSRDVRVYVVGKKIFAAVMRSSSGDFRANFSLGGEVCRYELSIHEIRIVKAVLDGMEFGMAGIDFIVDDRGGLILNEIEDVAGARMLYQCAPELDIVQEYLRYILEEKLLKEQQAQNEYISKNVLLIRWDLL